MDGYRIATLGPLRNGPEPRHVLHDIRSLDLGHAVNATWPADEASLRRQWEARHLWHG